MTKQEYQEYKKNVEAMRKASVASILGQSRSSKDVLTDAQRERTKQVREMLARGENPFEKFSEGSKGQPLTPEERAAIIKEIQDNRDLSPEQVRELERKWDRSQVRNIVVPELDMSLGEPKPQRDPTKLYCSFCEKEVDETRATLGRGPLRIGSKEDLVSIDRRNRTFETRKVVKVTSRRLVACPDCALHIETPKFPETRG